MQRAVVVFVVLTSACANTRSGGGSGRDSGPTIVPNRDTGPITPRPDTGPIPPPPGDGGGGMCATDVVPPWTMAPPCAAATQACIARAMSGAEAMTCITNDPAGTNCLVCVNQSLIACVNPMGCQADWNCFAACVDQCGGDQACVTSMCRTQNQTFSTCLSGVAMMCPGTATVCFPRADAG